MLKGNEEGVDRIWRDEADAERRRTAKATRRSRERVQETLARHPQHGRRGRSAAPAAQG